MAESAKPDSDQVSFSRETTEPETGSNELPDLAGAFSTTDLTNLGVAERNPDSPEPGDPEADVESRPGLDIDGRYLVPTDGGVGDPDRPHAVVVDGFDTKVADLDGDGRPDASHGGLIARSYHNKGFATIGYNFERAGEPLEPGRFYEGLVNDLKSGDFELPKGSVISSSWAVQADMKEYGDRFGLDLTPENLSQHREELMDRMIDFADGKTDLGLEGAELDRFRADVTRQVDIYDQVSELRDMGYNVISAARNNDGEGIFHPHAMFDDYHAYAVDGSGEQVFPDAVRNSITQPGPGLFIPKTDPGGGLSTDGDRIAEYSPTELSSGALPDSFDPLAGSSLAPPFVAEWMLQSGALNPDFRAMEPAGPVPAF